MMMKKLSRREFIGMSAALAGMATLPRAAWAKGSVVGAVYPGTWDEAFRKIVAPALMKNAGIQLDLLPLFAVEQIAKAKASRGRPDFDAFTLDPGPAATGLADGLFEPFDVSKVPNAAKLPPGLVTPYGVPVAAQFVGIAYNPKKFKEPPKTWADLFREPYVSRLGLTGFQTTFGTVSIIEIAKQFGGSVTNVEPFFAELKKVLDKVAVIGAPAAMAGLFQQGQCDIMYTNTQTVGSLKARGVDVEFVAPASGIATFFTTMHIPKGAEHVPQAYSYINTILSEPVQAALMQPPYFFAPVNVDVKLDGSLPIKSLAEMQSMVQHDWSQINPLRSGWIERFNKEVAR